MAEIAHTPGKWTFKTATNGDNGIMADGTGVFIECFAEIRRSGENARMEALANARLIAAAPELLEALKNAVAQLERSGFDGLSSGANDAIAKATGSDVGKAVL